MVKRKTKGTLILSLAFTLFLLGFISACNYCGDGAVNQLTEECDYGSLNGFLCWAGYGSSCSYCTNTCKLKTITNYCGDGILNSACEECDDGNTANGDGCSFLCEIEEPTPYCGDGICSGDETCFSCSQDCGICPPKKTTLHTTEINWEQFCEVNWQCTGWSQCNENGFMARKCTDRNSCSFSYNKPVEIAGCELQKVLVEEEEDKILLWVMMGITAFLLLILLVLLLKR